MMREILVVVDPEGQEVRLRMQPNGPITTVAMDRDNFKMWLFHAIMTEVDHAMGVFND